MNGESGIQPVVVFDGTCGFCSRLVAFILRNDTRGELLFSPNSSPYGRQLLSLHHLVEESKDTIVVVVEGSALVRSDAVILISSHLKAPYSWVRHSRYVPRCVRDLAYRFVAASRRFLPGNVDACAFLPPEQRGRIREHE